MAISENYRKQVELLVRCIPFVANESCFALKGGTAINLFHRNLPRLSVDVDLAYLPIESREKSLVTMSAALTRIAAAIRQGLPGTTVLLSPPDSFVTKIIVRGERVNIKIEVTTVLRGCVFEPEIKSVSNAVQDQFGFAEMSVVSFPDLYAGKLVAALDRQHPRDLFDAGGLLSNEGITDPLRQAFLVYLVSHSRPMFEILAPIPKDLTGEYLRGFRGMTDVLVQQAELENVRERLITELVTEMPTHHRRFLIGFENGAPDWDLIGLPHAANLPAVLWRQQNLVKLTDVQRNKLVMNLERVLA
jgi:Nucleotidyl transferase AbiEii toxin, Type IV TA system